MGVRLSFGAAAVLCLTGPADAQELRGTIRDSTGAPIRDAQVTLVDRDEGIAMLMRSNPRGEFIVRAADPGYYALRVRRLGYLPHRSNLLELEAGDTFPIEIVLAAAPATLSAVTVRAQRDTLSRQRVFGMNLRSIAGSIITPAEIEARAAGARNIVDVIRSVGPAWITSIETPDGDCVSTTRGGAGGAPCLMVYVDNVRIEPPGSVSDMVSLDAIDHVVLLRATDAGALFGTGAHNGVLLVYTRQGMKSTAPVRRP
jgi:hypothetical protein